MKLGKKLLAVALAGVLALSVLTGCSGSAVNGKKIAKVLSLGDLGTVEYDPSLNKTAENAMKAVKAKVDGKTITMENAIRGDEDGKLLWIDEVETTTTVTKPNGDTYTKHETVYNPVFTEAGKGLESALQLKTTNKDKAVVVALFDAKDIKDEPLLLASLIREYAVKATVDYADADKVAKMGYAESGNYMMVVIVGDIAPDTDEG